jgi:hypothetical protein
MSRLQWRKSSHSDSGQGECVEVARTSALVAVRDSKDPGGPVLAFASAAWRALMAEIKAG